MRVSQAYGYWNASPAKAPPLRGEYFTSWQLRLVARGIDLTPPAVGTLTYRRYAGRGEKVDMSCRAPGSIALPSRFAS